MWRIFGNELPEVLTRTVEIAERCDLKLPENINHLPRYPIPSGEIASPDEYFEKAEKLRSDFKFVYFHHGYALVKLMQDDRGIEKYTQAIRLDPIFIEAHHNLGLIYFRKNEMNKAADAFAEVLRQDPKHVSSLLYLARIYMSKGDKTVARNYLRTVLEVSPGDQQAAQLWQQLGS